MVKIPPSLLPPETPEQVENERQQLHQMLSRWKTQESEFRQFLSYRFDAIKFIGAGNATGLASLALFLTANASTSRPLWIMIAAKVCFVFFALGTALAARAYSLLYRFGEDVEHALSILRTTEQSDEYHRVKGLIDQLSRTSERTSPLLVRSIWLFIMGATMAVVGVVLQ